MKKKFEQVSTPYDTGSFLVRSGRRWTLLAVVCIIGSLLPQCVKDTSEFHSPFGGEVKFRSGDEYVQNGMLVLTDHARFQELLDELRESEDTQAERDSLYEEIGITEAMRDLDTNYTDHPGCLKYELDLGYTSMRRLEEDDLFALLNHGDQEVISIIGDPYGKTLLNQDGAIQIETRMFKFFESGLVVIVGNEDIDVFDDLNAEDESALIEGFNVRFGGVHGDKIADFYQVDASGNIIQSEPYIDVRVDQYYDGVSQITLVNTSFIEYPDETQATFRWIYSDNTYFIGQDPNRTFLDGDTVTLVYGNPTNGHDTVTIVPRTCLVSDFDITHISGTTYRFSAAISTPGSNPQYLLRWLFGDGTMAMGNVVEHTYAIGTPPSTIVTLQAIRNSGGPGQGTVACEGSKPLGEQPTCNKRNKKSANQDFAIGSERWRLDCSIWVDGGVGGWFTQGNVGSRSKSLKRGFAGIWSGRDAEQIWISLEGHYLRKINNSCLIRVVPFLEETEINSGNVQRNISDPFDPYLDPLQLWSTHRMKVSGQIWAYTQNGGKLYLD